MHEDKGDEETGPSGVAGRYENQGHGTGEADTDIATHGVKCIVEAVDDKSGIRKALSRSNRHSRHEVVEEGLYQCHGDFEQLTSQDVESEGAVDEERIELGDAPDDAGLA